MSTTYELFTRWRIAKGYPSDLQGTIALGLTQGVSYHWKQGRNATADIIERMCKDLGLDPMFYIIKGFEEAAQGDAKRTLARAAKRFAGVLIIGGVLMTPLPSYAQSTSIDSSHGLYIMRSH
ncbi:MAG: hypothetical protein ACREPB_05525 [Arenimonas sp.]